VARAVTVEIGTLDICVSTLCYLVGRTKNTRQDAVLSRVPGASWSDLLGLCFHEKSCDLVRG
jgi:hypothetical protein